MTNLRRIEPIEQYAVETCDGSEAKAVSHALSSGAYVSLLCDGPFMLTPEGALVFGNQLVKLAMGAQQLAKEVIATNKNIDPDVLSP